jgi:hypothetical protein
MAMIDMNANMTPLTVQMPADLIAELRRVAARIGITIDELVLEASAQFVEPYTWAAYESEWCRADMAPVEPSEADKADVSGTQP